MHPDHKILIDLLNDRFEKVKPECLALENWDTLVIEAVRHRIAPLIYHKIKQAKAESLFPNVILQKFHDRFLANLYRNTLFFNELSDLIGRLNKKGIPVFLLKGAHLAEFIYADTSLRSMQDIDILVKNEQVSAAVQTAFDAGFQFLFDRNPEIKKTEKEYGYGVMPEFRHFQALIKPETKCLLEIHSHIVSEETPFKIPEKDLWQYAEHENLNGNSVFLLSPEDLIIYLCLHAAYDHLFEFGLSAIYDIAAAINHYGNTLSWDEVQRRSTRWGTNQCLWLTLYLTRKWLDVKIPEDVFENFQVDGVADLAERRLFYEENAESLHAHLIKWRNLKSGPDKLRYAKEVLFPSRRFMANRYLKKKNSSLISSYLLRWFQMIQGTYSLLRTVVHDRDFDRRLHQGDTEYLLRQWLVKS